MGAFSILTILLSPKETNKQEKKTHQDNVKFVTKDFIWDNTRFTNAKLTILLHINITCTIYGDYGLNTFHYSVVFPCQFCFYHLKPIVKKSKKYQTHESYFPLNAISVTPFLILNDAFIICVIGAMIFNLTLGAYYPIANFISLQINGSRTGLAASITGFTQAVSAGTISFLSVKISDNGVFLGTTLSISCLILALLSMFVTIIIGNNKK